MKRVTKAVIKCKKSQAVVINTLAGRVVEKMRENAAEFTGTTAEVDLLDTDQQLLTSLISTARGNHVITTLRNEQAKVVYTGMQNLVVKVNTIAEGNVAIISKSGFPGSADLTPQSIPDRVVIKRVVNGKTVLSAKIFILSLQKRNLWYTVRTTTVAGADENDPSWKVVLCARSSYKLVIPDLEKNKEIYISVNAFNTHGQGVFSDPMSFSAK